MSYFEMSNKHVVRQFNITHLQFFIVTCHQRLKVKEFKIIEVGGKNSHET